MIAAAMLGFVWFSIPTISCTLEPLLSLLVANLIASGAGFAKEHSGRLSSPVRGRYSCRRFARALILGSWRP